MHPPTLTHSGGKWEGKARQSRRREGASTDKEAQKMKDTRGRRERGAEGSWGKRREAVRGSGGKKNGGGRGDGTWVAGEEMERDGGENECGLMGWRVGGGLL